MSLTLKDGRMHWVHWLIVSLSFVLTLAAWYISKTQIEEKIEQRFEFESSQLLALVSERMAHYEDALRAGVAAIHSQDYDVTVESWKRFSDVLKLEKTYLGINGIGVIFQVPPENITSFLASERKFRPGFNIHPAHEKNEYWPITYVEPLKGNELAVGLDMAFEKNRYSAAKKARDTSKTQITGPITLVQDAKKTPGFLQFVPFYKNGDLSTLEQRRKLFVGHVYAPFIMDKLIAGTLNQENRHLIFSVYDQDKMLYDELLPDNENYDPMPMFIKDITLQVYGRSWDFKIQTANSFRSVTSNNQSIYILVGGIIIDSMLIFLFLLLSNTNRNSQYLAEKMTKKLVVSESYFRHIIEAAPCGIIITNNHGIIERVNPQAEVLFGYKATELLGKSIEILVPDKVRNIHPQHREEFTADEAKRRMGFDRKVYGLKCNGEEFPAEIGLANFDSADGPKVLSTVIDMTGYVGITDELRRSNKDLNDFAYVASHDLKAPLRGIMQLSSWVLEDVEDIASEETKGHLALLKSRTMRLEKLLDDLLDYSRVGKNLGGIKQVDIKEMTEGLFFLLDPPSEFKLNVAGELPVFETLATPLEIIFRNLIGNAIKHHDSGSGIITISCIEHSAYYEFFIENDGPAIEPEHHEKIFEMFKTLKPRDEVEGSGMGLAIIKKILGYQGGDINVTSGEERGVSFIFTWPKKILNNGVKHG